MIDLSVSINSVLRLKPVTKFNLELINQQHNLRGELRMDIVAYMILPTLHGDLLQELQAVAMKHVSCMHA